MNQNKWCIMFRVLSLFAIPSLIFCSSMSNTLPIIDVTSGYDNSFKQKTGGALVGPFMQVFYNHGLTPLWIVVLIIFIFILNEIISTLILFRTKLKNSSTEEFFKFYLFKTKYWLIAIVIAVIICVILQYRMSYLHIF